jgi:hypothetical protein
MEDRDIQNEIRVSFDSVNLILKNEDDNETISRNIEHLKIKMNDTEFVNNLTEEQNSLILSIINNK